MGSRLTFRDLFALLGYKVVFVLLDPVVFQIRLLDVVSLVFLLLVAVRVHELPTQATMLILESTDLLDCMSEGRGWG